MVLVEESAAAMARLEDLVTTLKISCLDMVVWHRRQTKQLHMPLISQVGKQHIPEAL